jgi:hypothetical protein
MDEHRLGLKPILHKTWMRAGQRLQVPVYPRYEWLYVYGFVHPTSGRSFWLLMPTVSIVCFNIALREFHTFANPAGLKDVRLVVDRAGWHTSDQVQPPAGMLLYFLPPYSPELQPAEHLWALTDLPLYNRLFESLNHLQDVLVDRCQWLASQFDLVRSTTNFHWWPQDL